MGPRPRYGCDRDRLEIVTQLGETWLVAVAGLLVAAVEVAPRIAPARGALPARRRGRREGADDIGKELLDRARPTLNPIAETLGPSFPSGHTSTAAAFFAAAALVLGCRRSRRTRAALAGGAVGVAVAVACSRVLLDVHWLTDVVAGLALG